MYDAYWCEAQRSLQLLVLDAHTEASTSLCLQCRMQMGLQSKLGGFTGPVDCIKHLMRTEGAPGLGRGLSGTLARETFGELAAQPFSPSARRCLHASVKAWTSMNKYVLN
jgi:hypothetical protein